MLKKLKGLSKGGKKDKKDDDDKREKKSKKKEKNQKMSPELLQSTDYKMEDLLQPTQKLSAVSQAERADLFIHKLRLCSVMFEWEPEHLEMDDPAPRKQSPEETLARDAKRENLVELVDYVGKNRSFINDQVLVEMLKMIAANLFRTLPKTQKHTDDDDEPTFDPAWPHLQIVYEFFLRFIVSNDLDMKLLKKHINGPFVLHLLELFDSEDPRERDYLKTILHRIYAKFMSLRAFIRKAINNTFFVFIYETGVHHGIAELLEILGSIINGFALPLKQEHKQFLKRVLIPMHKVKGLSQFHQQLSYCVTQFVNKDSTLAVPVLKGIIKFWPITNSGKEVLFLNELEELLELTQAEEFKVVMVPLFKQLARTIGSPHFQVAERALFLWHNEYISALIADNRNDLLPILFPVLQANSQHHWNPTVNNLTMNVLKIFMDMDAELVDKCTQQYAEQENQRETVQKQRAQAWQALEVMAKQ